jgi:hypothetical protein
MRNQSQKSGGSLLDKGKGNGVKYNRGSLNQDHNRSEDSIDEKDNNKRLLKYWSSSWTFPQGQLDVAMIEVDTFF